MRLAQLAGVLLAAACAAPIVALAQAYPAKPVRLLVPYPPGGGTDIVARVVAQKFLENTGQTMIVENKPGGSEMIATEALARAAADGYTMGLVSNAFSINASLATKLPFDPVRDFIPVTPLVTVPFIFVVHPGVPAKTLPELVALARAKPGVLNYASLGPGTIHHFAMEWFKRLAGIDIVAVPYKGLAAALAAGMAGEVQVVVTGMTAGLAPVNSGKLRALAVAGAKRTEVAPELATVAELGFPGYDAGSWYGVLLPAGTPADIVARLNAELTRILISADVKERFRAVGVDTTPMSPAAFAEFVRTDIQLWARIVKLVDARQQ